jgi:hypothetical protein
MAIADRLAARFAGLYARCAGGDTHHVGAWFRGPEPAGAAAALVFFMGIFSDVPHVKDSLLERTADGRIDRALALGKLLETTQGLSRARMATLLGAHGGMIAGRPDGPTTLHFPFSDANRAARASRDIADAMNQGPGL